MATTQISNPHDGRQWTTSPRPKGRENAKTTLCRNVVIYGYCRNEKEGCPYNHDPTRNANAFSASQSQSEKMKRFNADSPSFMPRLPEKNGASTPNNTTLSPKAAIAAPFTPKSSRSTATSLTQQKSAEWSNPEVREFVPQAFNSTATGDQHPPPNLADPFNPYSETQNYALESTPPSQLNPYSTDVMTTATAPFYQPQSTFSQPLQYHLYAPLGPHRENLQPYQRTAHDLFIAENLRQDLQRKADATLQVLPNSNLPSNIEHFHSLVPLDLVNQKSTASFGYHTWLYKAVSSKDGLVYTLRRIEGFRLTSEKAIQPVQNWKRLNNANIVSVHDCFTTRAFGDSSLVFVTDYFPLSKTLAEQHFPSSANFHRMRPPGGSVPESVLWSFIVQIASALKAIHSAGLAAKLINVNKVLLTNKNRIRLNGCGILDVVQYGEQATVAQQQREDMQQLGRLILALATQNPSPAATASKALDSAARVYGVRLRECIATLVDDPPPINDFIASIADQFAAQLDNSFHAEDNLYSELNRELENARLVRLLAKLGTINERPEYNGNEQHQHPHQIQQHASSNQWSETGERYFLKLFRDFVFHQVAADGRPVVDLGHIVNCLNKLDAGSEEKIVLVSRDEQNVFVVSYKEVKRAVESAFAELLKGGRRG